MAPEGTDAVFSSTPLLRLAEDIQSSTAAASYAGDFLHLLPARVKRIRNALRDQDTAAALDAVLSLKVNAHMVGGLALERDCCALEQCLHDGCASAAVGVAENVARDSLALQLALKEFLRKAGDKNLGH